MKKITDSILFKLLATIFIGYIFFSMWKRDNDYKVQLCEKLISKKLNGVISRVGGSGSYQWIEIENKEKYDVNFSEIKSTNGITEKYFDYQINDSILKKTNSNEVIIKRGAKSAIYVLDCDCKN